MKKVLLIITDETTRQLYHELLVSERVEVLAADEVTNGILLLASNRVSAILLDGEQRTTEAERFLNLRKMRRDWLTIPLVLISAEGADFHKFLGVNDKTFNPLKISPGEVTAALVGACDLS